MWAPPLPTPTLSLGVWLVSNAVGWYFAATQSRGLGMRAGELAYDVVLWLWLARLGATAGREPGTPSDARPHLLQGEKQGPARYDLRQRQRSPPSEESSAGGD